MLRFLALIVTAMLVATSSGSAESLRGADAYGDWRADRPGLQRLIRPNDLPPPYASASVSNGSRSAALPASPALRVPPGFSVSLWAKGLQGPRSLKVAPNGDVVVAETASGTIKLFRSGPDGRPTGPSTIFAKGLDGPFGMAFFPPDDHPRWLYVATIDAVLRFAYRAGDQVASGPPQPVADLHISDGGHSTRDLVFSQDGAHFFVSVGSQSNVAEDMARQPPPGFSIDAVKGAAWEDEERRAVVMVFDADGKNGRIFATGLRNCVGLALAPGPDDLYCSTNERDGLGDNLPPDYVTRVAEGDFFGWPWFYTGDHQDPRHKGERPDLVRAIRTPDVLIQPHSAPLAMTFYTSSPGALSAFPSDYAGSAFVALHGSWNRANRTGYKVIRVLMQNGAPTGAYEDFLIGFVNPDGSVWGRPVGVAVARDGALLVSEDENGTIWRVAPAR